MYNLEQIETEKNEMRQAVLNVRAYKPIYVKIKINYGCNLKCEMCKHWRETPEPPISMDRFTPEKELEANLRFYQSPGLKI
jgi:MoaA/NifB/PqqE/SkfB family radical SAM enzyme